MPDTEDTNSTPKLEPPKRRGYINFAQSEALLNLLSEYAMRLRSYFEAYSDLELSRAAYNSLLATVSPAVITGAALLLFYPVKGGFHNNFLWIATALGTACVGATLYIIWIRIEALRLKRRRLRYEIEVTAANLKRLIQRASDIGEFGQFNFNERLEFDVRLAEAEAVLKYSQLPAPSDAKAEISLPSGTEAAKGSWR